MTNAQNPVAVNTSTGDLTYPAGAPGSTQFTSVLGKSSGTVSGSDVTGDATVAAAFTAMAWTANSQSGTSYTFVLGDAANTIVETTNASAVTLTVPPNASVAFGIGCVIPLRQYGAGQITVAPGAGVTIRSRGGALKLGGQYAEAQLSKRGTNEWILSGDVTA